MNNSKALRIYIFTEIRYMKDRLLALAISSIFVLPSCVSSAPTTTVVSSVESDAEFTVFANYRPFEATKVQGFLDSAFKQKITLDENLDIPVLLNGREKVKIRLSDGHIEIIYSKKDSSSTAYADVKKLGDDLTKKLMP
jgi:hypothetical protein